MLRSPISSPKDTSFFKKCLVIGSCWIYGLFWCICPLLGWSSYGIEGIGINCSIKWQSRDAGNISYIVLLFIFSFVTPVGVICFSYMKIYYIVKSHNRSVMTNVRHVVKRDEVDIRVEGNMEEPSLYIEQGQSQLTVSRERRIAKIGFIMASAFCLAWMPYAVVSIMAVRSPSSVSPLAATIPAIIAKSSTCYFPVIYGVTHTSFKREIMRIFRREENET